MDNLEERTCGTRSVWLKESQRIIRFKEGPVKPGNLGDEEINFTKMGFVVVGWVGYKISVLMSRTCSKSLWSSGEGVRGS